MADITALAAQNADYTSSTTSKKKLADDMDAFLTLLTAQLSNQDPLSPMDSTEFTNQLVQFSSVEQQIDTNENLESLLGLTQASINASVVSYIGKEIQAESSTVPLQDGNAKFTYTLPTQAKKVNVIIKDAEGGIVKTMEGETGKGVHRLTWDGKDKDGVQLEDGAYSLEIQAEDTDGKQIENIYTTATGVATSVASDGNDVLVATGSVLFGVNYIISVGNIKETTDSDTDTGSSDTSDSSSSTDSSSTDSSDTGDTTETTTS